MPARRRLLVLNQYYWPGVEATAHLLTELCEALAADYDVTVVTGRLRGQEQAPDTELRNGVRIVRVRSAILRPRPARAARARTTSPTSRRAAGRAASLERPDVDPLHDRSADGRRRRARAGAAATACP